MNKDEAIEVIMNDELDNIIDYLINCMNNNENVYVDYENANEVFRLYSSDIKVDETYERIYGLTKEQKLNYEKELNESDNKDEVNAKYKNMIDVYFDKMRDFSTRIDVAGKTLDEVIDIIKDAKKLNKNIYVDYKPADGGTSVRFFSNCLNIDREIMDVLGIEIIGLDY